jgi:hypothetical protein
MRKTLTWLDANANGQPPPATPIERAIQMAIGVDGRVPAPTPQFGTCSADGSRLTIPDFAYPDQRIAIFCDGFAFHGSGASLAEDARKRTRLQTLGWLVLTC